MRTLLLLSLTVFIAAAASGQDSMRVHRGFKPAGVPNLNYNSDEGFGYGARLQLFNHGTGGFNPYRYVVDANLFLTTRGRKQFFLFFDSPYLLPGGRRLTAEARYQQYNTAPYFGIGNDAGFDAELEEEGSSRFIAQDYYEFDRTRTSVWVNYQRDFGAFAWLAGIGAVHTDIADPHKHTLLALEHPEGLEGGFTNYVKVGLIYDTRDFEPAPRKGDWTDLILSVSNGIFGSDYDYTRLTLTNRHYFPLHRRLILAERVVVEKGWGDMPFYEMAFFESSFRMWEGIGGAWTVRGLRQGRLIGPSKLFGNLELRARVADFKGFGQDFYFGMSGFYDFGRVWDEEEDFSLEGLRSGYGTGLQLGWNETFIVTVDAARSDEVDFALYIGIGYLY